jgi:protease IV
MMRIIGRFLRYTLKISATVFIGVMSLFLSVVVAFLVVIGIGAGMAAGESDTDQNQYTYEYGDKNSDHKLAVVSVNGLILGSQDEVSPFFSLFSDTQVAYGYDVKEQLIKLAEDDEVKGVILQVNSPGGTIYGSMAIADGVRAYREKTHQPVFALVSSLAASGGYWVSVSADKVFADNGTAIGSIGVITGPFKYYKDVTAESDAFGPSIQTDGGITTHYLTAGKYKDLGNPYRELSDQERSVLQTSLDVSYRQFVEYVSGRRSVGQDVIRNEWGAMIYSAEQAVKMNMIDDLGNRDQVYALLARETGAKDNDYQVVKKSQDTGFFGALTGAVAKYAFGSRAGFQFCSLKSAVMAYDGDLSVFCR